MKHGHWIKNAALAKEYDDACLRAERMRDERDWRYWHGVSQGIETAIAALGNR